jgi:hypothetical protein
VNSQLSTNSNAINSTGAASTVTSCCARLHRFISGIARRVASVQWRSVFRRSFPPPVFFLQMHKIPHTKRISRQPLPA